MAYAQFAFGDVAWRIETKYDTPTIVRQVENMRRFNEDERVTYTVYLEEWYATRDIEFQGYAAKSQGWFNRLLMSILLRLERHIWRTRKGYAGEWIDSHLAN